VVGIGDEEGEGLVYGNVVRIGYANGRKSVIVAYERFSFDEQGTNSAPKNKLVFAQIELKTGRVTSVSDDDGSLLESLKLIDDFFP